MFVLFWGKKRIVFGFIFSSIHCFFNKLLLFLLMSRWWYFMVAHTVQQMPWNSSELCTPRWFSFNWMMLCALRPLAYTLLFGCCSNCDTHTNTNINSGGGGSNVSSSNSDSGGSVSRTTNDSNSKSRVYVCGVCVLASVPSFTHSTAIHLTEMLVCISILVWRICVCV